MKGEGDRGPAHPWAGSPRSDRDIRVGVRCERPAFSSARRGDDGAAGTGRRNAPPRAFSSLAGRPPGPTPPLHRDDTRGIPDPPIPSQPKPGSVRLPGIVDRVYTEYQPGKMPNRRKRSIARRFEMTTLTREADAEGRITLPERFANATLIIEQVSDSEIHIRRLGVDPDDELILPEQPPIFLTASEWESFVTRLDDPSARTRRWSVRSKPSRTMNEWRIERWNRSRECSGFASGQPSPGATGWSPTRAKRLPRTGWGPTRGTRLSTLELTFVPILPS